MQKNPGILVLADGTSFEGVSVGHHGTVCGEVVFNTAQVGYQEILTDPSYAGQLITFTQPHIGNVGINALDMESEKCFAKGVIMHSMAEITSNWRAEDSLAHFLIQQKMVALSDIDTRALTHHIRNKGAQSGCLMMGTIDYALALAHAKNAPSLAHQDLAKTVTASHPYTFATSKHNGYSVVVYDFGVKRSILRHLADLNLTVTVVPATTSAEEVIAMHPDGVVLSNGPGDPEACTYAVNATQQLLERKIPIMGICLGHQILALASGAKTEKMAFGHHGSNHPIKEIKTNKVFISSQNHGFVVSEKNLPETLVITHRSLFDNTIAGLLRTDTPAFSFQGHPEAGPGPLELTELFTQFKKMIEANHAKKN